MEEVCGFYTRYHSMRFVGRRLVLRLTSPVGDDELAELNDEFADIITATPIERIEASPGEIDDDDVPDLPRIGVRLRPAQLRPAPSAHRPPQRQTPQS